jgi:nucleotide-binding universal stress UspA family protein
MLDTALLTEDRRTDEPPAPQVLIAVDDTPAGRRTLISGLAQAAARDADVTVLHVVPARRFRVARMATPRAKPMRVRDPLESPVLRDARRLGFDHGIRPRLELVAAEDVDAVILALALSVNAATIVVGAGRPDGIAAPRGVCQGVLRRAPVPVFVVPS